MLESRPCALNFLNRNHHNQVELAAWKKELPTATPTVQEDAQPVEYEDVDEEVDMAEKLEYEKLREQFNRDNIETLDAKDPGSPAPAKEERVRLPEEPLKENIVPSSCEDKCKNSLKATDEEKNSSVPPKAVLKERQPVASFEKILPAPRKFSCVSIDFSDKPTLPDHLPARESRGKALPTLHHISSRSCLSTPLINFSYTEVKVELKDRANAAVPDTTDVSDRFVKTMHTSRRFHNPLFGYGSVASDLTLILSHREPIFLQDKGDAFFK